MVKWSHDTCTACKGSGKLSEVTLDMYGTAARAEVKKCRKCFGRGTIRAPMFGYMLVNDVEARDGSQIPVKVPEEQELIQEILWAVEGRSNSNVARRLNSAGVLRRGSEWTPSQIGEIRKTYKLVTRKPG
jgi:DnaJ-class molecular chaperone